MTGWVDLRAKLPFLRGERVHVVNVRDEPRVRAVLDEAGFTVLAIEGQAIRDDASLFDELARALSLPDHFGHNWDALTDALADAWAEPGARAVLWRDADQSASADLQTLLDAVRRLDDAAAEAGSWRDDGADGQVEIFLVGAGAGFE